MTDDSPCKICNQPIDAEERCVVAGGRVYHHTCWRIGQARRNAIPARTCAACGGEIRPDEPAVGSFDSPGSHQHEACARPEAAVHGR